MREIKFRAVIPEQNATIFFDSTDLVHPSRKNSFSIRVLLIPWLLAGNKPDEYTGLKDKNDKEIYEGDIVKSSWGMGRIHFEGGAFDILLPNITDLPDGTCRNFVMFPDIRAEMEVIGTVHENPELLIKE